MWASYSRIFYSQSSSGLVLSCWRWLSFPLSRYCKLYLWEYPLPTSYLWLLICKGLCENMTMKSAFWRSRGVEERILTFSTCPFVQNKVKGFEFLVCYGLDSSNCPWKLGMEFAGLVIPCQFVNFTFRDILPSVAFGGFDVCIKCSVLIFVDCARTFAIVLE